MPSYAFYSYGNISKTADSFTIVLLIVTWVLNILMEDAVGG